MLFAHDTECSLRSAVSLVNSAEEPDTLTDMAQLDAWYVEHEFTGRRDHDRGRAGLGARTSAGAARAAHGPTATTRPSSSTRTSPRPARCRSCGATTAWTGTSTRCRPTRRSRAGSLVETAMAMIDLIRADELSRLAVCADDRCDGLVLDLSRNRSRRYCSTTCANRNAVAAYRAAVARGADAAAVRGIPQRSHEPPGSVDRPADEPSRPQASTRALHRRHGALHPPDRRPPLRRRRLRRGGRARGPIVPARDRRGPERRRRRASGSTSRRPTSWTPRACTPWSTRTRASWSSKRRMTVICPPGPVRRVIDVSGLGEQLPSPSTARRRTEQLNRQRAAPATTSTSSSRTPGGSSPARSSSGARAASNGPAARGGAQTDGSRPASRMRSSVRRSPLTDEWVTSSAPPGREVGGRLGDQPVQQHAPVRPGLGAGGAVPRVGQLVPRGEVRAGWRRSGRSARPGRRRAARRAACARRRR